MPPRVQGEQRLVKTEQVTADGFGPHGVGVGEISTPPRATREGLVEGEVDRVVPGANVVVRHEDGGVTQVADLTPSATGLVGIQVAPGKGEPVKAADVGVTQRSDNGSERLADTYGPLIGVLGLRVVLDQEDFRPELLQDELLHAGTRQELVAPLNGGATVAGFSRTGEEKFSAWMLKSEALVECVVEENAIVIPAPTAEDYGPVVLEDVEGRAKAWRKHVGDGVAIVAIGEISIGIYPGRKLLAHIEWCHPICGEHLGFVIPSHPKIQEQLIGDGPFILGVNAEGSVVG